MEKIEAAMPAIAGWMVAIVVLVLWPWSTPTGILVAALASVSVRKLSRPNWRNPDHFT